MDAHQIGCFTFALALAQERLDAPATLSAAPRAAIVRCLPSLSDPPFKSNAHEVDRCSLEFRRVAYPKLPAGGRSVARRLGREIW
jgi:hypothetical protein